MGASRERKKRQEYYANGGVDKRAVREAEERAAQKRFNLKLGLGAGIFVLLAVFLMVFNSGVFRRGQTAVTVGDQTFTAADYSYYYRTVYNSYGNMAAYFASAIPDAAVNQMVFDTAALKAAEAEGFTYPADLEDDIQATIDSAKSAAKTRGLSYKAFIAQAYGELVTPEVFERNLRSSLQANAYSQAYEDSLSFTDADITAAYNAAPENYDRVNGYMVTVSGAPAAKTDAEGNAVEATEEEKAAAMQAAEDTARAILTAYKAGGDLETLAGEHENASYRAVENQTYSASGSNSVTTDWLFESGRRAGDSTVLEDAASWYVAVFTGRDRDETPGVNVRHILLDSTSLTASGATEEETDALVKQAAEALLAGWDGTEDGFAALAAANSKDTGSAADGGLIEGVYPTTSFVQEFLDWCFADGRKAGDTGIISSTYGYHIMYLSSFAEPAWSNSVRNTLMNDAYTAWSDALTEGYEAVKNEQVMGYVA